MITKDIIADDFTRNVVLQLFKSTVLEAPGKSSAPEQARATAFQETLSRIDRQNRTVELSDFDPGPIGDGCINFAGVAIVFGVWLARQGVELQHEAYFQRSDH